MRWDYKGNTTKNSLSLSYIEGVLVDINVIQQFYQTDLLIYWLFLLLANFRTTPRMLDCSIIFPQEYIPLTFVRGVKKHLIKLTPRNLDPKCFCEILSCLRFLGSWRQSAMTFIIIIIINRPRPAGPRWIVARVQFSWVNFSSLASRIQRSARRRIIILWHPHPRIRLSVYVSVCVTKRPQRLTHYPKANTLSNQRSVGHTAWAPKGREGRSQGASS